MKAAPWLILLGGAVAGFLLWRWLRKPGGGDVGAMSSGLMVSPVLEDPSAAALALFNRQNENDVAIARCRAKGCSPRLMNGWFSDCNCSGPAIEGYANGTAAGGGVITWVNPTKDNPGGVPIASKTRCEAVAGRVECYDPTAPAYSPGGF